MAKEKFVRLGAERFMSLDIKDYLSRLDRSLAWLEEAADPREAALPADFAAPLIFLLPEVADYE